MTRLFMRRVIDALMPKGAIWRPVKGGDFDRLLDGVAKNKQVVLGDLENLAHVRNPLRCPIGILQDLEREYGVTTNVALTEKERRMSLAVIRYKRIVLATTDKLQFALNKAGFGLGGYGLTVTRNSSPVQDPERIGVGYILTAHGFPSVYCAGNTDVAYCGYFAERYYLSSGDSCDEDLVTPPKAYWSSVFFVGGQVSRANDGQIINISPVNIPSARKQELHRLILRIKPLGIWVGMIVRYF